MTVTHPGPHTQPVHQHITTYHITMICSVTACHCHCCRSPPPMLMIMCMPCCRGCLCIGCNTTATQAIRMAYFHTSRLFASLEKKRTRSPDAIKLVGARLSRVLHAHICLLLDTQARQTATRSLLSQSQLCLQVIKSPNSPCLPSYCACVYITLHVLHM